MKFVHVSDLHLGKILYETHLLDDQSYILGRILDIVKEEQPDAVLISGDVYDRGVPPSDAVCMFDSFIVELSKLKRQNGERLKTFIIYGNHDSPERVSFANKLLALSGIHISPIYNGKVEPIVMNDEFGEVYIYMLPYIGPAHVRDALTDMGAPDEEIEAVNTYTDAVKKAIELIAPDPTKRNVLVTHQSVRGGETYGSETVTTGGLQDVDPEVFEKFNYVALGHLHTYQTVKTAGGDNNLILYSGAPLKYKQTETRKRCAAAVELGADGSCTARRIELNPKRDLINVENSYEYIRANLPPSEDYMYITLTDEQMPSYYYPELNKMFPNIIRCTLKKNPMFESDELIGADISEELSPLDTLKRFFSLMKEREMTETETKVIERLIEKAEQKLIHGEETPKKEAKEDAAD